MYNVHVFIYVCAYTYSCIHYVHVYVHTYIYIYIFLCRPNVIFGCNSRANLSELEQTIALIDYYS